MKFVRKAAVVLAAVAAGLLSAALPAAAADSGRLAPDDRLARQLAHPLTPRRAGPTGPSRAPREGPVPHRARSAVLSTFPLALRGSSARNSTSRGTL